jgi:hypothetical protein
MSIASKFPLVTRPFGRLVVRARPEVVFAATLFIFLGMLVSREVAH